MSNDDPMADPEKAEAYKANINALVQGILNEERQARERKFSELTAHRRDEQPTIIGQSGFSPNIVAAQ